MPKPLFLPRGADSFPERDFFYVCWYGLWLLGAGHVAAGGSGDAPGGMAGDWRQGRWGIGAGAHIARKQGPAKTIKWVIIRWKRFKTDGPAPADEIHRSLKHK